MTFSTGRGISSEVNVTPMIDVLLVVLTIFMATTPVAPKGLEALLPRPPKGNQAASEKAVVLQILHTGTGQIAYKINQTDVARDEIRARLGTIFSTRSTKVLFIAGTRSLISAPLPEASILPDERVWTMLDLSRTGRQKIGNLVTRSAQAATAFRSRFSYWAALQGLRKQLQSLRREVSVLCPVYGPPMRRCLAPIPRRKEAE